LRGTARQVKQMRLADIGREVVVIISENETVVGTITDVNIDNGTFRLITSHGREYQFTETKVIIKFKGVG